MVWLNRTGAFGVASAAYWLTIAVIAHLWLPVRLVIFLTFSMRSINLWVRSKRLQVAYLHTIAETELSFLQDTEIRLFQDLQSLRHSPQVERLVRNQIPSGSMPNQSSRRAVGEEGAIPSTSSKPEWNPPNFLTLSRSAPAKSRALADKRRPRFEGLPICKNLVAVCRHAANTIADKTNSFSARRAHDPSNLVRRSRRCKLI